jgi:hypothetical protein
MAAIATAVTAPIASAAGHRTRGIVELTALLRGTRERALIVALTVLGFALRAWGTTYGFTQPWAKPDEDRWVHVALGLLEDPDPKWFEWPSLHGYLLASVYWLWGRVRVMRGDFPSWHAFLNEDPSVYPSDLVLLGRLFSALIGALVVPLAWRLGDRIGPRGAGLVAAVFLAVSFGPVRDAHWALIEAFLLVMILVTLYATVAALERPTLARFSCAGLLAGLTTSAKYSGVTLAAPIALAAFLSARREGRGLLAAVFDRRSLTAGAVMVAAFVAGSPFMVVSRAQFWGAMVMREWSYRDASFDTPVGFVHHLRFSLWHSHGLPLELAGILGLLIFGLTSGARAAILIYGLATYLALGPARIIPMRYASSLAPAIALGAAWGILFLARRTRRPGLFAAVATLALCVNPLTRDVQLDWLLSREDTRVTARRWLDLHLAPGEAILARDSKSLRWGRPLLEDRYRVIAYSEAAVRAGAARWVLVSESFGGYVPWAPEMHAFLRRQGGQQEKVFDPFPPTAKPEYDPHDAFFVPVAGFKRVRDPGPKITIYRMP